ncbi:MAG: 3-isopropylmalate dehydratase large subunit [Planctomycetota bacterium]
MGMTITEKILASHAGRETAQPGDVLTCDVDFLMANDITAPMAIDAFNRVGAQHLFDKERVAFVFSHFVPAKDVASAEQCEKVREFARAHDMPWFFDIGRGGIEHILLPQEGLVGPGDLVLGADSHSCTYGGLGAFATGVGSTDLAAAMVTGKTWLKVPESMRLRFTGKLAPWVSAKDMILHAIGHVGFSGATYMAMEFEGEAVENLSVEGRLTLCNMAIEAGAKNGVIAADAPIEAFMAGRAKRPWKSFSADKDANYAQEWTWRAEDIGLTLAKPFAPDNICRVEELVGTKVDQVFIGSCTNARMEDLRIAAHVMRGRRVAKDLRCIVIPATHEVYRSAIKEGLIEVFVDAGCAVSESTCGPCLGGHNGVLGSKEVCVSTSNRNFPGRMGHPKAQVYLASPAVAAATAIAGEITHPSSVADEIKETLDV